MDWKKADTANGRALFGELRCVSCHAVNGRGGTMGPELSRIGDKVGREWLFSFLKDPHRDQPDTQMLQYRLGDDQVRDLAAFLLEEYRTPGDRGRDRSRPLPGSAWGDGRAGRLRAPRLPRMPSAGRCARDGQDRPSLAGIADRDPDQLPYGERVVRHTTDNYIFLKLLLPDALGPPSLMPTFAFTSAQAATITVALASLRKADLPSSRVVRGAAPAVYRPQGPFGALVSRYRCLSCHPIGGSGGGLSTVPLDRIGSQLQRDYLVRYLLNPGAVRVSIEARMPVFHMLPEEARTIADYAAGTFVDDRLDGYDAHFTQTEARRGAELYRQLGCVGCHQLRLHGGYVGPDLSDAGTRLRPGWTAAFLQNPGREKPGTLQPDYGLSPADTRALTAYVSGLGVEPAGPTAVSGRSAQR